MQTPLKVALIWFAVAFVVILAGIIAVAVLHPV